jgi:hypothetical protein
MARRALGWPSVFSYSTISTSRYHVTIWKCWWRKLTTYGRRSRPKGSDFVFQGRPNTCSSALLASPKIGCDYRGRGAIGENGGNGFKPATVLIRGRYRCPYRSTILVFFRQLLSKPKPCRSWRNLLLPQLASQLADVTGTLLCTGTYWWESLANR